MCSLVRKRLTALLVVVVVTMFGMSSVAIADDTDPKVQELQAQLEEAKELLEKDKAAHDETAEKKRMIDEKLAAQKEREARIYDELKALCEEQDKLQPGSLDGCMARIDN